MYYFNVVKESKLEVKILWEKNRYYGFLIYKIKWNIVYYFFIFDEVVRNFGNME